MICRNCGTNISDNLTHCPVCGFTVAKASQPVTHKAIKTAPAASAVTSFVQNNSNNKSKSGKKTPPKKVIIACAAGTIALALIIFSIVFLAGKDTREFKKALKNGDEHTVESLYTRAVSYSSMAKKKLKYDTCINDFLKEHYGGVKELTFEDGATASAMTMDLKSYQDKNGYDVIECIEDLSDISSSAENYIDQIEDMYSSKNSYITAVDYATKGEKDSENYLNAVRALSKMSSDDAMYEKGQELIKTETGNYISAVTTQADTYIANGDFSAATNLLKKAQQNLPNNKTVTNKINEVIAAAADKYVAKAEESFKAGDVNAAIGNIQAAIGINPNNDTYQSKLENYQLYIPFDLCDKDNVLSSSRRFWFYDQITAINRTEYNDCIEFLSNSDDATISYLLEGKYDTVKGIWFSSKENTDNNRTGSSRFEAYGDGKLLYTSNEIGAESLPSDFSFSVSGIQKLEIKVVSTGICGIVTDMVAYKNIPK